MLGSNNHPEDENLKQSESKRLEALERIEQARRYQAQGDLDASQTEVTNAWYALDEALEICPQNHRARFLLVSCAMNAEDYSRAKAESLKIYKDLNHDQLAGVSDSVLHLSIAHASKMLGELEDAVVYTKEATELYPDDPQPYMVLGELYEAVGRNQEAEKYCRQAILRNDAPECCHRLSEQNLFFTLCCLTSCLVRQARCTEAEHFCAKAIELDHTSTLAFRHLADVYHFQGRHDDALATCEKIQQMDPEDDEVMIKMDTIRADQEHGSALGDYMSTRSKATTGKASSLPKRERDVPGQISAAALRAPPPAGIDGQIAVAGVARALGSSAGSRRSGRGQALDACESARRDRERRIACGEMEKGSVNSRTVGSKSGSKKDGKEAPAPAADGGWGFCCMDRSGTSK